MTASGLRETRLATLPPNAMYQGTVLSVHSTVQVCPHPRWRRSILLSASDFDWYKPIGQNVSIGGFAGTPILS